MSAALKAFNEEYKYHPRKNPTLTEETTNDAGAPVVENPLDGEPVEEKKESLPEKATQPLKRSFGGIKMHLPKLKTPGGIGLLLLLIFLLDAAIMVTSKDGKSQLSTIWDVLTNVKGRIVQGEPTAKSSEEPEQIDFAAGAENATISASQSVMDYYNGLGGGVFGY